MRYVPWVACTDTHGDMIDARAATAFKTFVDAYRPRLRFHLGDVWDLRAWRRGASEEEKRDRMKRDFTAGMEFLEWYRPTHLTLGNHDVRLWDQLDIGGPMVDLAEEKIKEFEALAAKLKCRVYPYDKRKGVLRVGKLKCAHGFFDGPSAARQMAQAFGSILFGHGHSIDVASTAAEDRRAARMIGCLCRLNFRYNRAHVNALRQAHGWAYGPLFRNGTYQAFQAELIAGRIVCAEKLRIINF